MDVLERCLVLAISSLGRAARKEAAVLAQLLAEFMSVKAECEEFLSSGLAAWPFTTIILCQSHSWLKCRDLLPVWRGLCICGYSSSSWIRKAIPCALLLIPLRKLLQEAL